MGILIPRRSLHGNDVIVLAQSAVAVTAPADTNENTLATYTLPGGTMGLNDSIEAWVVFTNNNSGGTKTFKIDFGGTDYLAGSATTTLAYHAIKQITNRNSLSSQVGAASAMGIGTGAGAVVTSSVNTAADVVITITGTKSSGADTITLEAYSIRLIRSP